jgi:hypothetical protein
MKFMKKYRVTSLLLLAILVLLAGVSCSKSDDEVDVPSYPGTWERTWFDEELNQNLIQTLEVEEERFSSSVMLVEESIPVPYLEYNGNLLVIDNRFESWIVRFGKVAANNNKMSYIKENKKDFDKIVFENLKVHPNFVGLYFIDGDKLTLILDRDGDGIASRSEGEIDFLRVTD